MAVKSHFPSLGTAFQEKAILEISSSPLYSFIPLFQHIFPHQLLIFLNLSKQSQTTNTHAFDMHLPKLTSQYSCHTPALQYVYLSPISLLHNSAGYFLLWYTLFSYPLHPIFFHIPYLKAVFLLSTHIYPLQLIRYICFEACHVSQTCHLSHENHSQFICGTSS